jgi:hypothetical protein
VTMADGSLKKIEDVRVDDMVRSGLTGAPVRVSIVDQVNIGKRKLMGFSGVDPFVTEDHCLMGVTRRGFDLVTFRAVFNKELSMAQKHWNSVAQIHIGNGWGNPVDTETDEVKVKDKDQSEPQRTKRKYKNLGGVQFHPSEVYRHPGFVMTTEGPKAITNITQETRPFDEQVYDVITYDHTLIVNGIHVFDDMVEIEKHPIVSILIGRLIEGVNWFTFSPETDLPRFASLLFSQGIFQVLFEMQNDDRFIHEIYNEVLDRFILGSRIEPNILHLGSELWRSHFHELKMIENSLLMFVERVVPVGVESESERGGISS